MKRLQQLGCSWSAGVEAEALLKGLSEVAEESRRSESQASRMRGLGGGFGAGRSGRP